jgi:hypothetical protein
MRLPKSSLYAIALFILLVLFVIGAGAVPRVLVYQGF